MLILLAPVVAINTVPYITSKDSQFGPFIEGVAVDKCGQIYATNYGNKDTLDQYGMAKPQQQIVIKQEGAKLNGAKFINSTHLLICDYQNHQLLALNILTNSTATICKDSNMLQPNDIAIANDGAIYLSGMRYTENTKVGDGDLWMCKSGKMEKIENLGRTNGIEVSHDQKWLYLSEAFNKDSKVVSNKIWRYELKKPQNKKLFIDFEKFDQSQQFDIDGIRSDVDSNLYIVRNGKGEVIKVDANAKLLQSYQTSFKAPTNIELGDKDGKTLYVVGRCEDNNEKGCVDKIEVETEGSSWAKLNKD